MSNFISRNTLLASIARLKVRKAKAEEAKNNFPLHDQDWLNGTIHGLEVAIDELELVIKEDKYWSDVVVNLEKAKRHGQA